MMDDDRTEDGAFSRFPIFIGGFFKSGTTLLRAMLGQHSSIASGLETQWFTLDWGKGRDEEGLREHVERLRHFYGLDPDVTSRIVEGSGSAEEFLGRFLGRYTRAEGKRRWAEKTPGNILHVERIFGAWPEARFIHIIRDPRDVFASLRQARKWDAVEEFAEMWCRYLGAAEAAKRRMPPEEERYLEVRYESLIQEPRETMMSVTRFLGEPWEEGVAEFDGKGDEYRKVLELTGKASTTLDRLRQPLSRDRIGIWKRILEPGEIQDLHREVDRRGMLSLFRSLELPGQA